jgi:hypothetical protein
MHACCCAHNSQPTRMRVHTGGQYRCMLILSLLSVGHIFQVVLGLHATGILSSKSSDYVRSFETIDEALEWSLLSDPCLAVPRICTQCHVCLASSITAVSRRARKIPHSMAVYRSTHALTHSLGLGTRRRHSAAVSYWYVCPKLSYRRPLSATTPSPSTRCTRTRSGTALDSRRCGRTYAAE